jgi:EAL domain-containing protein (putative c-di-GMP-specific phosphodiesterase class I)
MRFDGDCMRNLETFRPDDAELRHALDRNEFVVHYQPLVELATGRLFAVEALVRWQHPEYGLLSPGRFIEVSEETGFSIPLSEAVLRSACLQAREWHNAGFAALIVSLNPAIRQARAGYLRDFLRSTLEETAVDPSLIAVELHEEVLPSRPEAETLLAELGTLGLQLWADDFGTGPSAIRYLRHFRFTLLKVDREFVATMAEDPHWALIVGGLIGFAHHLGMRAVAEGVTSDAQLELLRAQGCDFVQGWRYCPPVSAAEMTAMLQARLVFT